MAKLLKTLNPEVGKKISLLDSVMIAGLKIFSEQALSKIPMVGNGTIRSGVIKAVSGVALTSLAPKSGAIGKGASLEATALMVDAGEDIYRALFGGASVQGAGERQVGQSNQGAGVKRVI